MIGAGTWDSLGPRLCAANLGGAGTCGPHPFRRWLRYVTQIDGTRLGGAGVCLEGRAMSTEPSSPLARSRSAGGSIGRVSGWRAGCDLSPGRPAAASEPASHHHQPAARSSLLDACVEPAFGQPTGACEPARQPVKPVAPTGPASLPVCCWARPPAAGCCSSVGCEPAAARLTCLFRPAPRFRCCCCCCYH